MIRLVLPYPVSTNRYKEEFVPKGWTRSVRYLTPAAKQYKRDIAWIAKQAGFREPTSKPIALTFTLIPKKWRRDKEGKLRKSGIVIDLSNALKVAEDALQGIVYVNDRQTKRIAIEYGEPDGDGALIVDIEEFEAPPVPVQIDLPVMIGDMAAADVPFLRSRE